MRFPLQFRRQKGGASSDPLVGSDTDPRTAQLPPAKGASNILFSKIRDANGWPVQRVAVGFTGPTGSTALNLSAYIWEAGSSAWYLINATPISVAPGELYFVDVVSISEPTPTLNQLGQPGAPSQAGSIEMALCFSDPGSSPNGVYVFTAGPDLTTVGT